MRDRAFWERMLPVIQGLIAGKTIQFRHKNQDWKTLPPDADVGFFSCNEYRIKPAVIKYRRYLYKLDKGICMGSLNDYPYCSKPFEVQQEPYFVKWIDTEWQEYELPVDAKVGG